MSARLVVLISGNGSNLQAIIEHIQRRQIDAEISCVISNKSSAYGLVRAQQATIATQVINDDVSLLQALKTLQPDLIILAGYMRIISAPIIQAFAGKIINIHPSLLPKYRGLDTHKRVLEAGDSDHGTTVHIVTEVLDDGPILAQERISIQPTDSIEKLEGKIKELEHRLYPKVIQQLLKKPHR